MGLGGCHQSGVSPRDASDPARSTPSQAWRLIALLPAALRARPSRRSPSRQSALSAAARRASRVALPVSPPPCPSTLRPSRVARRASPVRVAPVRLSRVAPCPARPRRLSPRPACSFGFHSTLASEAQSRDP